MCIEHPLVVKHGSLAHLIARWDDHETDPDDLTFWYLGEYSEDTGAISKRGNYIPDCTVVTPTCGDGIGAGNEVCGGAYAVRANAETPRRAGRVEARRASRMLDSALRKHSR